MCRLTTSALLVSIFFIGGLHAHPARAKPWRRGGGGGGPRPNQVEEVRHHATPTPFPEPMYSEEEFAPSLEEENFLEEEDLENARQEAEGGEEEEEPIEFLTDDNQDQLQEDAMAAFKPHNTHGEDMIRARAQAQLRFIDVMLIALGPEFQKNLPTVGDANTLATVPTTIHIPSDSCPSTYMRCSSQTFFPSCEVPRNTDEDVWAQRFNLYFNTVSALDNDMEVINSTLRLYKNEIVPLKNPSPINVEVYSYSRSLNKRRDRHTFISKTKVLSNYTGWVSVNVKEMARKWKIRRNHGLLVRVTDELDQPYNARALFVNMDCDTGLQPPLPLGVSIDEEGEKYPALSIRQGIVDIGMPEESEDYVSTFSSVPTVPTPRYRTDRPEGDDMVADDPSLMREGNMGEEYEEYVPRVITSREQTSESPRHARPHTFERHLHPSHIHSEEQMRFADRSPNFDPSITRHRERSMAFQHAVSVEDQRSHRHRPSKELRRQRRKHQQQQQQQQQQQHHHHQSQHQHQQSSASHVSHTPSRRTDSRRIHPTPELDNY